MKFSLFFILNPTPDFPHFYYMLGGNLGSPLYGDVSVMKVSKITKTQGVQRRIIRVVIFILFDVRFALLLL